MSKKIFRMFFLVIVLVICSGKSSWGFVKEDFGEKEVLIAVWITQTTDKIKSDLEKMNCTDGKIQNENKIKGSIKITKIKNNKYRVEIDGGAEHTTKESLPTYSYDELKKLFRSKCEEIHS